MKNSKVFHEYNIPPQKVKATEERLWSDARCFFLCLLLLCRLGVFYTRQKDEKRVNTLSDVSLFFFLV